MIRIGAGVGIGILAYLVTTVLKNMIDEVGVGVPFDESMVNEKKRARRLSVIFYEYYTDLI